jgi:hypothetical protein
MKNSPEDSHCTARARLWSASRNLLHACLVGLGVLIGTAGNAEAAPFGGSGFTPGSVVVVRVGDGIAPLSSAATAAFLDEYDTNGVLLQTIALPTATSGAHRPLTLAGSATSEGFLGISSFESSAPRYLVLGCYAATPGTASVAGTSSTTTPRVIGRVDMNGNVNTTTALLDAFSGGNIRSVASDNGSKFWISGSNQGVRFVNNLTASSSTLLTTIGPTNNRVLNILGNFLHVSSASGAFHGLSTVGTGFPPTSPPQTITLLPGFPAISGPGPYDFVFPGGTNTIYVADDRAVANGGGLQKWNFSGGAGGMWSLAYTLNTGLTAGLRGVSYRGGAFFATTADTPSKLVRVNDSGPLSPFQTIATAGSNQAFRGVRALPVCLFPAGITSNPSAASACPGASASFTVGASGTAPISYKWFKDGFELTNGGSISGATSSTLTIDPVSAGDAGQYFCGVANACGTNTSGAALLTVLVEDTDGDLTPDCNDLCPTDPNKVAPGACGCGVADTDTDGDLTPDCNDLCPNDPNKVAPGVCGCGVADTDTDGDLTPDCNDLCPTDPNKIAPGVCGCGVADTDTDGDLTPDCNDLCPNDPNKIAPGVCGCGVADTDTDGDLTPDCNDLCPTDPNKIAPGVCGCGVADTDTDGDLTPDCNDLCPTDPNKVAPGACGCGVADVDTDGDLTLDCNDLCPTDPLKVAPGACGCGVPDTDTDGDTVADCNDLCPTDPTKVVPGLCGCLIPEGCSLGVDINEISISAGGVQQLYLYGGLPNATKLYFLLGSVSGTTPGMTVNSVLLPLNDDPYFQFTLTHHGVPPLLGSLGILDNNGNGSASFNVPPATVLLGLPLTVNHAYVVIDVSPTITVVFGSNAAPVVLVP